MGAGAGGGTGGLRSPPTALLRVWERLIKYVLLSKGGRYSCGLAEYQFVAGTLTFAADHATFRGRAGSAKCWYGASCTQLDEKSVIY